MCIWEINAMTCDYEGIELTVIEYVSGSRWDVAKFFEHKLFKYKFLRKYSFYKSLILRPPKLRKLAQSDSIF